MNAYNYLNLNVLISHTASCLNRDDLGMQKTLLFGGVRRTRISSQALKRVMRNSSYYREQLGTPSIRSRNLGLITDHLRGQLAGEFDEAIIGRTARLFVDNVTPPTEEDLEAADAPDAAGGGKRAGRWPRGAWPRSVRCVAGWLRCSPRG